MKYTVKAAVMVMFSLWVVFSSVSIVAAAEYPARPITLILPHPPGGGADLSARPLAKAAEKYLGQEIIVENRGGGGGTIGPTIVSGKSPDGYTIGIMTTSSIIAYSMGRTKWHPIHDISYIMTYTGFMLGVAVRENAPWKTIQEFVAYGKQHPNKVSYASSGLGTTAHFPMEELAMSTGARWVHVPCKGASEAMPSVLGGHTDAVSTTSAGWGPLVEAGKLRLLATFGDVRSEKYSMAPTLKEAGYDVVWKCPLSIIAPKGLPKPIAEKLHNAFKKAMDDQNFQKTLKALDFPKLYNSPEDAVRVNQQEFVQIEKITKELGLNK